MSLLPFFEQTLIARELNIQCIRQWLRNAEEGFVRPFEEFFAANFIGHTKQGPIDLKRLKELELEFARAFPGARYQIDELSALADKVLLHVRTRAVHRDTFHGIAATGRKVEFGGLVVYRMADGKICECWDNLEFDLLMRQITSF